MIKRRYIWLLLPALLAATLACGPLDVVRDILRDFGTAYCEDPLRVTKLVDTNDGVCGEDDCSLREAIIASNDCEGKQTIILEEFAVYELSIEGDGEDESATGDLDIWDDVDIYKHWPVDSSSGLVPHASIDANGIDRVLDIHAGNLAADWMMLGNGSAEQGAGLRIAAGARAFFTIVYMQGNVAASDGGAVYNAGRFAGGYPTQIYENRASRGGAIFSTGEVDLGGCFIYDNRAEQAAVFVDSDGAVDFHGCSLSNNEGTAVINRGLFTHLKGDIVDHLVPGTGGVVSDAVALLNEPGAEADLDTTTISGNQSSGPGAAIILNLGELKLRNVTMYMNNPVDIGVSNPGDGETTLENTILALSGERNCHGSFVSQGGNMLVDPACGLRTDLGDMLLAEDPGSLGLPTVGMGDILYFPLEGGSPAVDGGTGSCYFEDIRRGTRPIDGDGDGMAVCDSGAYEFEPMEALSLDVTVEPTPTPAFTPAPSVTPVSPPTVVEDTLCWKGPGSNYETVSSLQAGAEVELLGRGEIEGWWVIDNPRYPGVPCWTPEDDLHVDTEALPPDLEVFPVPPLPTPTPILGCLYHGPNDSQPVCYPIENCPVDFEDSLGACTP
jgi:CSLREA domain-containing protein